jgi:ferredoxin-NADP reductase
MVLIYAVRTPADIAFKAEFELFASTYHVPITYVLSTPTPGFESGYVDKEKIVRLVPDFFDRDVYLCGPPPMMAACVTTLTELGIPKKDIHFEKFSF